MSRVRLWSAAALLCLCTTPSMGAAAEPNAADSAYRDYRIPDHRWWQWTAGVSGSASHHDFSIPDDQSGRSGTFRGQVSTSASGGRDSDPLSTSWGADVRVSGLRQHEEQSRQDAVGPVEGDVSSRTLAESFALLYSVRAYPWRFPLGLTAGTTQRFDLGQQFLSTDFQRRPPGTLEQSLMSASQGSWYYAGSLSAGAGIGRVRDATPVYEAQVLEERLLATGTLTRPLARVTRDRLAALFTTQGRFVFAHDRPDKYFWERIEQLLAEDGALADSSIGLHDAHRLLEPLTLRGQVLRPAGWFVGPAVVLSDQQTHRGIDRSQSLAVYQADTLLFGSGTELHSDSYARQDLIQTALVAEYHHPAGMHWQYDAAHTTRWGESGVPMQSVTAAQVAWIVTDRWLATGSFSHGIDWSGSGTERSVGAWTVNVGADLSYFLEDVWAVTLSAREAQSHTSTDFRRGGDYLFGITRVISGLFEAPGLVSAMHPVPGGR